MTCKIQSLTNSCTACCACINICPPDAISMVENVEGFRYPSINSSKCTECGLCDKVCPELNFDINKRAPLIKRAYYGWHNDENIRKKSSSGGAFSAIAENVLKKRGLIFGAVYDYSQKMVMHKSTEDVDLSALRKSKYVQSYIGDAFRKVKKYLIDNREVFFVGTPCQVSGLQSYLGKEYKNLITCDLICHGVPPMKLLNDHLFLLEKKFRTTIVDVDFRPKTVSWSMFLLKCLFSNGNKYEMPHFLDCYFSAFIKNLSLRRSCYQCNYCEKQHHSDLTLADFWGYRRLNPNINDERGLSLILINTEKGESVVKELQNMTLNAIDWKYAEYAFRQRTQESYNESSRDQFFNYYSTKGWKKASKKFQLAGTFRSRLRYFIIRNFITKFKK